MDSLKQIVEFVLHFDKYLQGFIENYGTWTYAILFAIVFAETGLIFMPFLPGDSLLFAAGILAGDRLLSLPALWILLTIAAIAGDAVNYLVGRWFGQRLLSAKRFRLVKPEHLAKTEEFFQKYGSKTIVIARFVPIVRTVAPFVAGMGKMPYRVFSIYNIAGGILWVSACLIAGYLFGKISFVKDNFSLVVLGIVIVSVLPIAWELAAGYLRGRKAVASQVPATTSSPDEPV
ncbi:Inner membrane protein YqjA [Planctopirus ephydatiae]|uniref:Inner membrane protein YqjA n=1 Tax=Planctopirus ephydatiae TaxID=2528019 RepID=A0A518GQT2_9PLAN|nr:DedA family protein [Planctopirus ephydatiae]QDV30955.1 Inner membrane protein YqjA [Planctopirus ephydatiae]